MEDIVYFQDDEGNKLSGLLSEVSKFIVILCHGYKGNKNGQNISRLNEELLTQGVSTFRFDFFAHGDSDGKFENLTVSKCVNGLLSAIDMLKEMGFKKIGIMGFSMGGLCALMAAARSKDVAYLALKSPVSDFVALDPKLSSEFTEDAKKNVAYDYSIKIPVFIVHGDKDAMVPLEQSVKLNEKLPNSKLEIMKGTDHLYLKHSDLERSTHLLIDFIIEHAKR